MTYLEFMRGTLGSNWVIARRTPRILAKYGEDVVCISKQRMRALDKEFRRMYGDPYNKVSAAMYLALKALCEKHTRPCFQGDPITYEPEWQAALDALKAEQERP